MECGMTPEDIELAARRRYNAVNDTFWAQQEIFDLIYAACLELASDAFAVERTYSTTTVSGTQEYDFPTSATAIKRVTWGGKKLTKIDMIEDDLITGLNQDTTDTGNPEYYWTWNNTISLRPIPGSAETLKIWTYNVPSEITTATQDIEIPDVHHSRLINFVLSAMASKDSNYNAATYYLNLWEKDKIKIRQAMARQKRTDKFTTVKNEELIAETSIGGL
jgi:hypothetical protein